METAGSHALIIVLAVLHELRLSKTIASLWPRTRFGVWFPANSAPDNNAVGQYALALKSAHFLSSVTTNRLLCYVTLGLVLGRRDAYGYIVGVAALLVVVWMVNDVDAMSDDKFFGSHEGDGAVAKAKHWWPVTPAKRHLIAVVFLNAIPLLLGVEDWKLDHDKRSGMIAATSSSITSAPASTTFGPPLTLPKPNPSSSPVRRP